MSRFSWVSKKLSSISLAITLIALTVGCTQKQKGDSAAPSEDVILIGEVVSMTGIEATYGLSAHRGISLAIEKLNAAGGIRNKKIKVITMDSGGLSDESARAITKLISQDKVFAVLTGSISSNALAMAPIAQKHHVPLIATVSTNPKVTELGDYIFRVCLMDTFQGTVVAKFALQDLKLKKVAILRDVKSDYSIGLANAFTSVLREGGGEILVDQTYSAGDIDFKSQLTAIRAKNPEAIYIPGYYTDISLIARQARELGMKVPLLGGDGWDSPKLKEIGGQALTGSFFSAFYSPEAPSPRLKDFLGHFNQAYGSAPDGLAVMGYEGVQLLADALQRAKTLDSDGIKEALGATQGLETVTGVISMGSDRNAKRPAVVVMIDQDGSLKYRATVQP